MSSKQQWITGAALLALLGLALLIYWPGLKGPLLLDDIPNLQPLRHIGPVDDWHSFWWFVLHNSTAYPIRPLSLASFLVNDLGWPLYTWMHKYTNLMVHLLNGVLVFWLAWLLTRVLKTPAAAGSCIALATAALWLLAPLQVSTVLYVIQRMTELSAMFVLAALITYTYGRLKLPERPLPALVQMTLGVAVFGLLGFLCKENAILLGLYALVLEWTVFRSAVPVTRGAVRAWFAAWQGLVLAAPVAAAFAYLVLVRNVFAAYDYRPFTPFERIASQPRILFDYLQNLLAPTRHGMGLTHDDYLLSTGLLSPPTTLLAILALAALVIAAIWASRKSASVFGLAVLWFFAGHLLESSVLALERYWEHRNYVPAFGPFFALAFGAWTLRHEMYRFIRAALVVYTGLLAVMTWQNVGIWSSHLQIAETWAAEHPRSVRAQQIRADFWSRRGYVTKADEIMSRVAELRPSSMGAQVQVLLTTCRNLPEEVAKTFDDVMERLPTTHFDHAVAPTVKVLMDIRAGRCPDLSQEDLLDLMDRLLENDSVDRRPSEVTRLLAMKAAIISRIGTPQAAVSHLYAAFQRRPSFDIGLLAVDYLYDIGQYQTALQVLNETRKIKRTRLGPDNFKYQQLDIWEQRIKNKLNAKDAKD